MFTIETTDGVEVATADSYSNATYGAQTISREDSTTLHVRNERGNLAALAYRGTLVEWRCNGAVKV